MLLGKLKHNIKEDLSRRLLCTALAIQKRDKHVRIANIPRVVYYPNHNIAYNRIAKCGNSSVLLYLHEAIRGEKLEAGNYGEQKRIATNTGQNLASLSAQPKQLLKLNTLTFFTVTRNPWTRALSAFLDKVGPGKEAKHNQAAGFGNKSQQGFTDFVHYLLEEGLHTDKHWTPQNELLLLSPANYKLCKLEQLCEDLPSILIEAGITPPKSSVLQKPHTSETNKEGKITNANKKINKYYTNETIEAVAKLYKDDFEMGNYSLDPTSIGFQ